MAPLAKAPWDKSEYSRKRSAKTTKGSGRRKTRSSNPSPRIPAPKAIDAARRGPTQEGREPGFL